VSDLDIPDTDEELLAECDVHTFKGSGPGGQSVNTTDSAVRLVHRPTGTVVTCRAERSQLRNKRECLRRLRAKLEELAHEDPPRVRTRTPGAAKARRYRSKTLRARRKRERGRPDPEGDGW
jgi:peptide chain release factor 2